MVAMSSKESVKDEVARSTTEDRREELGDSKKTEAWRKEVTSIWNGSHTRLQAQKKLLLKRKEEKLIFAEIWKAYQLAITEKLYESEKKLIEKELEASKAAVRDRMISELLAKKRKWLEEHEWPSILESNEGVASSANAAQETRQQRKLRKRNNGTAGPALPENGKPESVAGTNSKAKKVPIGPPLACTLKDFEIEEDLEAIRKEHSY